MFRTARVTVRGLEVKVWGASDLVRDAETVERAIATFATQLDAARGKAKENLKKIVAGLIKDMLEVGDILPKNKIYRESIQPFCREYLGVEDPYAHFMAYKAEPVEENIKPEGTRVRRYHFTLFKKS